MSHIDSITGVRVADILEIFKPDELEQLFSDMEEDRKQTEISLKSDKLGLYWKLRKYGEDFGINIVKVINILDAKYRFTFKTENVCIVAEVIAYDTGYRKSIHGKLKIKEYTYSGSFYEPPDYDIDIFWLPHTSSVKVHVPRSVLDDPYERTGMKGFQLNKPEDAVKLYEELTDILG